MSFSRQAMAVSEAPTTTTREFTAIWNMRNGHSKRVPNLINGVIEICTQVLTHFVCRNTFSV